MPEALGARPLLAALTALGIAMTPIAAAPIATAPVAASIATAPVAAAPMSADLVSAIGAVEAAQAKAWNERDAHGYAALFAADADVVSPAGGRWKGRGEVEAGLRRAFDPLLARRRLTIDDIAVRSLAPDIAVAHVGWSMSGATGAGGSALQLPRRGVQTQVLRRDGAGWLIVALHDTSTVSDGGSPGTDTATGIAPGTTAGARPVGGASPSGDGASDKSMPSAAVVRAAPLGRCLFATGGGTCLMRGKAPKPVP